MCSIRMDKMLCALLVVAASALPGVAGVKAALLVVDVQRCFTAGGSLAVTDGNDVIPVINDLRRRHAGQLEVVAVSQDWHCANHVSFASQHAGKNAFETVDLGYKQDGTLCTGGTVSSANFPGAVACDGGPDVTLTQALWPDHCVMDVTSGGTSSSLVPELEVDASDVIVKKGTVCNIDAYSLFFDNGKLKSTGLENTLRDAGVDTVFVTGLALDYCVFWTAMDAKRLGFETFTVLDASRGVAEDTVRNATTAMANAGVNLIYSQDVGDILNDSRSGAMKPVALFASTLSAVFIGITNMF